MKPRIQRLRQAIVRGFTLIELLVVLVILAALAALIVPNIGMFGRSSDMAVSAKSQADIANQISLFFVTQKRYPAGMDSLITTGTAAIYAADPENTDTQTRGLPYAGSDGIKLGNATTGSAATPAQLTLYAVPANNTGVEEYLRSITRAGLDFVYDHDTGIVNSNLSTSGTTATPNVGRTIAANGSVAELTGPQLLAKLHPQPLRAGEKIIAFGFGPRNAAISKTTTTTPLYPGADKTYYGRYIVYFKIYASGERATLVGVSDSYGRTPDYTQQQFNESLPDGGRQG